MNFPQDSNIRKAMEKRFFQSLRGNMDEAAINLALNGLLYKGVNLDLKTILVAPFDDLMEIAETVKRGFAANAVGLATLYSYFNYEDQRNLLYDFFIAEDIQGNIDLCTCHYCNIDFINVYDSNGGYLNKVHFLNTAPIETLNLIPGIKSATSQRIIAERGLRPIKNLSLSFLTPAKRTSILTYKLKQDRGIFTLDHFYPQYLGDILVTSLYNLIPSCAPCNSRFKHMSDFQVGKNTTYLSPTSQNYVVQEFLVFGLLLRPGKNVGNIKSVNDIELIYENYIFGQEEFLEIFSIPGRYSFHKKEAVKLILKFQRYPESYIDEIEKSLKYSVDRLTIMKDLFGADIFEDNSNNQPLAKLRKDIAVQIGLI